MAEYFSKSGFQGFKYYLICRVAFSIIRSRKHTFSNRVLLKNNKLKMEVEYGML